jgi:hypothetical protein
MKDQEIQKILDAWNEGKPVWLDGNKHLKKFQEVLSYIGSKNWDWRVYGTDGYYNPFKTASLTPPEQPKKKTRKMTPLEMAYRQGARCVFRKNTYHKDEWALVNFDGADYDKMARILDEGRSLGPWVDCTVEVEDV